MHPWAGSSPTSSSNTSVNPIASLGALQSLAAGAGAGLNVGSLAGTIPTTTPVLIFSTDSTFFYKHYML